MFLTHTLLIKRAYHTRWLPVGGLCLCWFCSEEECLTVRSLETQWRLCDSTSASSFLNRRVLLVRLRRRRLVRWQAWSWLPLSALFAVVTKTRTVNASMMYMAATPGSSDVCKISPSLKPEAWSLKPEAWLSDRCRPHHDTDDLTRFSRFWELRRPLALDRDAWRSRVKEIRSFRPVRAAVA
jgi:hypothetical protein